MSYNFNLLLKQTSKTAWTLYSDKGFVLFVFHSCRNRQDAEAQAKAWASSWNSVHIQVVDNEQDEHRNKVPSKA